MSIDSLQFPTSQELSALFQEEDRRARAIFQDCTDASNSPVAGTLSDALHGALGFAYFVADAQWGKLGEKGPLSWLSSHKRMQVMVGPRDCFHVQDICQSALGLPAVGRSMQSMILFGEYSSLAG